MNSSELKALAERCYELGAGIDLSGCLYGECAGKRLNFAPNYYKLLAGLAAAYQDRPFIDVGTHEGGSCLAMIAGGARRVFTIDRVDKGFDPGGKAEKIIGDACRVVTLKKVVCRSGGVVFLDSSKPDMSHILLLCVTLFSPFLVVIDDIYLTERCADGWRGISGHFVTADISIECERTDAGLGIVWCF